MSMLNNQIPISSTPLLGASVILMLNNNGPEVKETPQEGSLVSIIPVGGKPSERVVEEEILPTFSIEVIKLTEKDTICKILIFLLLIWFFSKKRTTEVTPLEVPFVPVIPPVILITGNDIREEMDLTIQSLSEALDSETTLRAGVEQELQEYKKKEEAFKQKMEVLSSGYEAVIARLRGQLTKANKEKNCLKEEALISTSTLEELKQVKKALKKNK